MLCNAISGLQVSPFTNISEKGHSDDIMRSSLFFSRCFINVAHFLLMISRFMFYVLYMLTGPPHGLHILELRKDSLVLLWELPTFNGRSPVTGYYVDIKEGNGRWRGVQERSTKNTYLQVCL